MKDNLDANFNNEITTQQLSTRTVGVRYGVILAGVGILYFIIMYVAGLDMQEGLWKWSSFIYVIALLVLAQKYFKEKGNGFMTYGQGVGIAFWAGLISSIINSIFTYCFLKFYDDAMITTAMEKARAGMEQKGNSEEQIEQAMKITSKFMTPEVFGIFGLVGGIIGLVIIGLIISAFMQKTNPNSTYN